MPPVSSAQAETACNAYGVTILEDGDWDSVLNEASVLYVAMRAQRHVARAASDDGEHVEPVRLTELLLGRLLDQRGELGVG